MPEKLTPPTRVAPCNVRTLLHDLQLADKWTYLILYGLLERTMRFNEIRRMVDGISQKMLTQCLRNLERNGLVRREVLPTSPVTVEYTVTALGQSVAEPMFGLSRWILAYQAEIQLAQQAFDLRRGEQSNT